MCEVKYISGDLVQLKQMPNTVCTVIGVMSKFNIPKIVEKKPPIYEIIIGNNEGLIYLNEEDIIGMPLTPKTLETNGWIETLCEIHNSKFKGFEQKMFHMILEYKPTYKGFSVFYWGEFLTSNIEYVHQLQHLLFGLGLPMDLKV